MYHATLVEISLDLIEHILDSYLPDNWWVKVWKQFLANENLGLDKVILLFVFSSTEEPLNADPYFLSRPKPRDYTSNVPASEPARPMHTKGTQLIYPLDCVTGVCQLFISPAMARNLLAIAHGRSHPGFAFCHEIISRS